MKHGLMLTFLHSISLNGCTCSADRFFGVHARSVHMVVVLYSLQGFVVVYAQIERNFAWTLLRKLLFALK